MALFFHCLIAIATLLLTVPWLPVAITMNLDNFWGPMWMAIAPLGSYVWLGSYLLLATGCVVIAWRLREAPDSKAVRYTAIAVNLVAAFSAVFLFIMLVIP